MSPAEFRKAWAEMERRGDDPVRLLAELVAAERMGLRIPGGCLCSPTGWQPGCPVHGESRRTAP